MDVSHPVAVEMFKFGLNHGKTLLAFQTYMELCEVYIQRDVDYHYNSKLELIYISCKDVNGKTKLYITVNVSESATLTLLSEWQRELVGDGTDVELYLVLRDSTTTGVYYKVTNGFAAPLSLEAAQVKKSQQDRKEFTRVELYQSRHHLYQQAKKMEQDQSLPGEI